MLELTYLKELILIRQANQKSDIFHCWHFLDKVFKFQPDVCNGCHDVLMMSVKLSNIVIPNIQGADYFWIIDRISIS